jgi:hypothetical protein
MSNEDSGSVSKRSSREATDESLGCWSIDSTQRIVEDG